MKIRLTIITYLLVSSVIHAQQEKFFCGTPTLSEEWESEFQKLISKHKNELSGQSQSSINYIIPVIFHVIHGGEPIGTYPNLWQGQILSQLTILNQDFSGSSYNSSIYPLNAFTNWAVSQNIPSEYLDQNGRIKIADLNIQFCLATQDTNGTLLSEPGIDRVNFLSMGLPNPNTYATQNTMRSYLDSILKPQTNWDVTKYLNVWITDKNNELSYAGVSSVPPLSGLGDIPNNSTDSTDGIWCYAQAIGSYTLFPDGNYISEFIDGRTLTHEVGHYLGLRHIWGDMDCGNDFCNDTPPAAGQNTGTPSYPHNAGSCAFPSNNPDGEMFMNFMDYTRGPSKYMFTTDQKIRVHTAIQNSPFRNQLGTHNLCSTTNGFNHESIIKSTSIYPNPVYTKLNLNFYTSEIDEIYISNLLGQVLITAKNKNMIDVSDLTNGVYILTITQGHIKHSQKFMKE
jgi:hypothetical protein